MASNDWREALPMTIRMENVTRIQAAITAAGEHTPANAMNAAFMAETEAYEDAHSLTAYLDVCRALASVPAPTPARAPERPIFGPERPPPRNIYEPRDVDDNAGPMQPEVLGGGVPAEDERTICSNSAPFPACFHRPSTPGTTIGRFQDCHLVAEGLVSKVYRIIKTSALIALKVTDPHPPAPHNPQREYKIMKSLIVDKEKRHPSIGVITETLYDQEGHFVMVQPYFPLTLADILDQGLMSKGEIIVVFTELFSALAHLHKFGIIHRDIKPSNIISSSRHGPIQLIDFGTAWDPVISLESGGDNIAEPADNKIIEVGTGPYRAPETLFGHKKYGTALDMWSAGCVLSECLSWPTHTLFGCPPSYEDGNQLGLIVSIFKTLGTPTPETWPEAMDFPTRPFEWYREFPARPWDEGDRAILPARPDWSTEVPWEGYQSLVKEMVVYESGKRLTAQEAFERLEIIRENEENAVFSGESEESEESEESL